MLTTGPQCHALPLPHSGKFWKWVYYWSLLPSVHRQMLGMASWNPHTRWQLSLSPQPPQGRMNPFIQLHQRRVGASQHPLDGIQGLCIPSYWTLCKDNQTTWALLPEITIKCQSLFQLPYPACLVCAGHMYSF